MGNTEKKPTMVSGRHVEFSYNMGDSTTGRAYVVVNATGSYITTVAWVSELVSALQMHIPFKYDIASEPEVHILGGKRVKGMLCVEFLITFSLTNDEVHAKLEDAGFHRGTECILG
jgi:hypothetical protein